MTLELPPRSKHPALIHVAASDEGRGRIIVALTERVPDERAATAAADLANAYGAAVECIFVEDAEVFRAAAHGFVRQVYHSGRIAARLDENALDADILSLSRGALRAFERHLTACGCACKTRTVRDDLVHALSLACAENGPWNLVVFGNAATPNDLHRSAQLLTSIAGLTGVLTMPQNEKATTGPIAIILDRDESLPQMLRTADRLRNTRPDLTIPIAVILVGPDADGFDDREGRLRLAIATLTVKDNTPVTMERVEASADAMQELRHVVDQHAPSLIIAQAHALVPDGDVEAGEILDLPYPILLVR